MKPHTKSHEKWWAKKDVKKAAILSVILTPIIGYSAAEVQVRLLGAPASQVMKTTENLMYIFTWAAAPVMAIVFSIAIVSLGNLHYGDNPPPEADHAIRNSSRSNIIWVTVSAILCLFAVVGGMIVLQHDNESILDDHAVDINVTGQQWVWNYDYPRSQGVRSNELHLVVNKPVVFHVTAVDVKHSFWIVELGVKIDANPGAVTEVAVNPNKLGVFNVRCAELCGLLHSFMQNKVYVQTQEDYDNWLLTQPKRNFSGDPFPKDKGEPTDPKQNGGN
jgi:cytochrome c oxidase subunit 2